MDRWRGCSRRDDDVQRYMGSERCQEERRDGVEPRLRHRRYRKEGPAAAEPSGPLLGSEDEAGVLERRRVDQAGRVLAHRSPKSVGQCGVDRHRSIRARDRGARRRIAAAKLLFRIREEGCAAEVARVVARGQRAAGRRDHADGHRAEEPEIGSTWDQPIRGHSAAWSKHVGAEAAPARLNTEVQRRSPYSRLQKPQ